jgi:hypothetical protein
VKYAWIASNKAHWPIKTGGHIQGKFAVKAAAKTTIGENLT